VSNTKNQASREEETKGKIFPRLTQGCKDELDAGGGGEVGDCLRSEETCMGMWTRGGDLYICTSGTARGTSRVRCDAERGNSAGEVRGIKKRRENKKDPIAGRVPGPGKKAETPSTKKVVEGIQSQGGTTKSHKVELRIGTRNGPVKRKKKKKEWKHQKSAKDGSHGMRSKSWRCKYAGKQQILAMNRTNGRKKQMAPQTEVKGGKAMTGGPRRGHPRKAKGATKPQTGRRFGSSQHPKAGRIGSRRREH